ncbi:DUF262 domain-containing protein [Ruminococcus albus]|uniref:GmrSD restriction endonucleases N-terminal domain-containing protein n=1 Tax=Ruminococcus albus TaxID=1264 RepID=A0A1I1NE78_RUMAL|nr:DUF262 domain-containing protein [Ruminococcus albus]SFC95847.1 Protein of unknown function DUF262 [Ruminococcus albus]
MRINKELQAAADMNPTKKSTQMSIFDMCDKISKQAISLPLYQRDLSWTLDKCIALLNYQLLGKAPVSPISMNVVNNTQEYVPQVSFIDREIIESIERGQLSVVDGQQRLTTNYKAYTNDNDFRNVVLDISKGRFIKTDVAYKNNQIPVGILLNQSDSVLFEYTNRISALRKPEITSLLLQVRSKIKNYNYTINSADDLSEDEQIEWFEVLNNAGSRVSIIQMRFSKLKMYGIDIYKQYTSVFNNRLIEVGYDFFTPEKTTVSYPIAALNPSYEIVSEKAHSMNYAPIPSDTKENQLCVMHPDALKKCLDLTLQLEDKVLDFIEINTLKKPDRIDYINYMIGYFAFNGLDLSDTQKEYLVSWYNTVDFTNKTNSERREIYTKLIENK